MAFGKEQAAAAKISPNKTARGFLKSQMKAKLPSSLVKNSEYTFFRKKVRLNVVEKQVH